ncbi:ribbon-helix-helix protein, CopG family [Listeria monocytogenes]|nr:ribbon-helix-helix protein, CopG family [Listeria monocytogenes]EAC9724691.1 ribbon-helix-helix protein, CopG family [Listeria monocytogenes]EAF1164269.1 ribbon-helix-helix protein, CopG family [Listeria monocytogenes]EAF3882274.1 ribbon-helix-helix protein, CopG family [Listeria monocytogenes]EAF8772160.1 ribbon-helix-helix protein, CopG family [Listeria monocytogenes]
MGIITVRVDEKEKEMIQQFAEINQVSVSTLIRQLLMEKMDDEVDLRLYAEAMEDQKEHPETYSFDTVMKELGHT